MDGVTKLIQNDKVPRLSDITDNTTALTEINRMWSNGKYNYRDTATEVGGFSVQISLSLTDVRTILTSFHLIKDSNLLSINAL